MKLHITSIHRGLRSGVSLIEVMVGIAIAGIVLGALYSGISFGFSVVHSMRDELRATQIMVEHLERTRLYTWSQITDTNFMPQGTFIEHYYSEDGNGQGTIFAKRIEVDDPPLTTTYAGQMRQVTIHLKWTNGSRLQEREMTTFVAKNGLQSYIIQ
jgi:prepilin-type N-terminal cleavage/methylation domain-containing protein